MFTKLKNKITNIGLEKLFTALLLIILGIEIIYLIKLNFWHMSDSMDHDAAKLMMHMIEIVRNRRLLIPDWSYMTTHEIDSAMLCSIPFYIITKNVYLSFGFANTIYIFAILAIVLRIFKNCGAKLCYALITSCLIFMPYQFGMLEYLNMMFFRGAQYSIKILIPLLAIAILTYTGKKWKKIILLCVWFCLIYLCSFSSGLFPFMTGLIPIIVIKIKDIALSDKKIKEITSLDNIVLIIGTVISIIGFIVHQINNISPSGINAMIAGSQDFPEKIHICFSKFLSVINALPSYDSGYVEVISLAGFGYICRFVIALALLCVALFYLIRVIKTVDIKKSEKREVAIEYFVMIIAVNVFIHLLCSYDSARYYIIESVCMMFLVGLYLASYSEKNKILRTPLFYFSILLVLALCWITSKRTVDYGIEYRNEFQHCYDMCNCFKEQDVDNVIFVDNTASEEVCRILMPEQKFSNYSLGLMDFESHDWYTYTGEASYYGTSVIIVASGQDNVDEIFADSGDNYENIGNIAGYNMYRCDDFCLQNN